ncbi:Similar to Serine/threonine-protein kinase AfsK; acc. no. P54742 [Pyronema omphalodes CBS 100304]|uniref:Similar to Serine/threonine-protein kinase AfsK acc. no. P54742 n=1 Tax=Pyronema omphalodes (strain CBS 100304) TaxID=1076935 RepID=U4KWA5_PYROM|nr:Similar to Serine/threonine-protein kinase AfsK; acc. no. P54742 [Pyronema omphalodes CBS 100304]
MHTTPTSASTNTSSLLNFLNNWYYQLFIPSFYLVSLVRNPDIDGLLGNQSPAVKAIQSIRMILHNEEYIPPDWPLQPLTLPDHFRTSRIIHRDTFTPLTQRWVRGDSADIEESEKFAKYIWSYKEAAHLLFLVNTEHFSIPPCCGYVHRSFTPLVWPYYKGRKSFPARVSIDIQITGRQTKDTKGVVIVRWRIPKLSWEDKIVLAQKLAKAMMGFHILGLVHKNIRPENILISPDGPYLVGYENYQIIVPIMDIQSPVWQDPINIYKAYAKSGIRSE